MITKELKLKILETLKEARSNFYGSDAKFAISIGISGSQYSRIKNGEIDKVLSDSLWLSIARRFNVSLNDRKQWKLVKTPVFEYITGQLKACQENGLSYMLCDYSDIGKTEAARYYARTNKNAVYVDCSQVKSKQLFIRYISREFGLGSDGKYADVYNNLVYYIQILPDPPIIILDEWGDVDYATFMEVKALKNGVGKTCAFYYIGAEGLESKMRRGITNRKVGYTEMYSRSGRKYGKLEFKDGEKVLDKRKVLEQSAVSIIKANAPEGSDFNQILRNIIDEDGHPSLRRLDNEFAKHK